MWQCKKISGLSNVQSATILLINSRMQFNLRLGISDYSYTKEVAADSVFSFLDNPLSFILEVEYYIRLYNAVYIDIKNSKVVWKPDDLEHWATTGRIDEIMTRQTSVADLFKVRNKEEAYSFNLKRLILERIRSSGVKGNDFIRVIFHSAIPDPLNQYLVYIVDFGVFLKYLENIEIKDYLDINSPYAIQEYWKNISKKNFSDIINPFYHYITFIGTKQIALYNTWKDEVFCIENLDYKVSGNSKWRLPNINILNNILEGALDVSTNATA